MKLPRDISGRELISLLKPLGYVQTHHAGSHIRLTTSRGSEHHLTVPDHSPVKPGTLNSILRDIAVHHGISRDELLRQLFG